MTAAEGEAVGRLAALVGWRLTAYLVRAASVDLARGWADGAAPMPEGCAERAGLALEALTSVAGRESDAVARAWMVGLDPRLDDRSPASLIRDRGPEVRAEILAAARAMGA